MMKAALFSSGAFNSESFKEVLNCGKRLPSNSSITFEGIMKEYFYQTGVMKVSDKLLETAYSIAVDHDPISAERQIHLALGLHSCKDGLNERRDLNLVVRVV
ncbi:predicted protein [Naegleria gruberi]|uniref:Predicted protein n=1 Tax=Naegleria gruberi TaxID=5762 RepID=D2VR84_NAEGR|nr:uncharacterized protein NAEGRDRAFT_71497 [Naegleria gruberi]EFC40628.1 predicted protein [Naegleria gruberi]|eukprot:XP_002673372.1 predicted protein [Naegleria gruberi strain NEG-M]